MSVILSVIWMTAIQFKPLRLKESPTEAGHKEET